LYAQGAGHAREVRNAKDRRGVAPSMPVEKNIMPANHE